MTEKEKRIDRFTEMVRSENLNFIPHIKKLDELGFFTAPASTHYHGAYSGGLFDHSAKVAQQLLILTDNLNLQWQRPESPLIVGLYHDLCKCDAYRYDVEKRQYVYNDVLLDGHGEKSVIIAQQLLELTEEEILCIRWHMGAFEKDPKKWDYYGRSIEKYPNVLYTHTADMIASRIVGV